MLGAIWYLESLHDKGMIWGYPSVSIRPSDKKSFLTTSWCLERSDLELGLPKIPNHNRERFWMNGATPQVSITTS